MQRFYEKRTNSFGNPASGLSCTVYLTGTTTKASLFQASDTTDTATTVIANPIVTGGDGIVKFAIADGDYDLVFVGADGATENRYRVNMFDSTTSTTIPVSSISLTVPTEFQVTGSPGTTLAITKDTEIKNTVWAGPTTGADAEPTFRALVAADLSTVACLLTTGQTVAGAKAFSDAATFASTVEITGALTCGTTATVTGNLMSYGNQIYEKTSKIQIDSASPAYPWKSTLGVDQAIITSLTPPTVTAFQGSQYLWAFSETTLNSRMFTVELPYDYEAGTDIYLFVDWSPNGTNTGVCRWGFEYSAVKSFSQGAFPAMATVYVETAGAGTQYQLQTSTSAAITGTNFEPGTKVSVRLFRDAAHGNDTLTVASYLHAMGCRYRASRVGTKNQTPPFFT